MAGTAGCILFVMRCSMQRAFCCNIIKASSVYHMLVPGWGPFVDLGSAVHETVSCVAAVSESTRKPGGDAPAHCQV